MNLVKSLMNFFVKKESLSEAEKDTPIFPDGVCSICWGREEYEGKFNELSQTERFNRQNVNEKKAFIQDFVTKHVDGIKLVQVENEYECVSCKTRFPLEEHKHF